MLRKGVYRTIASGSTIENHGGVKIVHNIYWYLCFYSPKPDVGLYGTENQRYFDPYVKSTIQLKGEIIEQVGDMIVFYVNNKDTGVKIHFEGRIEGERLNVKYFHENKPEEVFEDTFQYLGTGEGN